MIKKLIIFALSAFYREHEATCQYAPVQCPNSSLCPSLVEMVRNWLLRKHTLYFFVILIEIDFLNTIIIWDTGSCVS